MLPLVLFSLAAILASRAGVETYAGNPATRLDLGAVPSAPAWTAPCRTRPPRKERKLLAGCARVKGRVVWVGRHKDDPHVIVMARFGLVVAKLDLGQDEPGFGQAITMVGPLVRARGGLREVDVVTIE